MAIRFADQHKLLIPLGSALDALCQRLELDLDLAMTDPDAAAEDFEEFSFSSEQTDDTVGASTNKQEMGSSGDAVDGLAPALRSTGWQSVSPAPRRMPRGMKRLKESLLKHGRVLPNNILDVSAFMDSMVDVDLMDACATELAERFVRLRPSKILTVATTGLVLAIPLGRILQVPVVYARKQRSVVMADSHIVQYSSKSHGSHRELMVSKRHLDPEDRVLLVDDFLSSGAAQEAMMRLCGMAGSTPIGVTALLEKVFDSGRIKLSGYDVPVETLVRILDLENDQINIE